MYAIRSYYGGGFSFNIRYNGFGKTLTSLASIQPPYKNLSELAKSIQKRYPFLQMLVCSLQISITGPGSKLFTMRNNFV